MKYGEKISSFCRFGKRRNQEEKAEKIEKIKKP